MSEPPTCGRVARTSASASPARSVVAHPDNPDNPGYPVKMSDLRVLPRGPAGCPLGDRSAPPPLRALRVASESFSQYFLPNILPTPSFNRLEQGAKEQRCRPT